MAYRYPPASRIIEDLEKSHQERERAYRQEIDRLHRLVPRHYPAQPKPRPQPIQYPRILYYIEDVVATTLLVLFIGAMPFVMCYAVVVMTR